jgi:hypothetical protein
MLLKKTRIQLLAIQGVGGKEPFSLASNTNSSSLYIEERSAKETDPQQIPFALQPSP